MAKEREAIQTRSAAEDEAVEPGESVDVHDVHDVHVTTTLLQSTNSQSQRGRDVAQDEDTGSASDDESGGDSSDDDSVANNGVDVLKDARRLYSWQGRQGELLQKLIEYHTRLEGAVHWSATGGENRSSLASELFHKTC